MIATLEGSKGVSLWERFSAWIVSTENRLYIGMGAGSNGQCRRGVFGSRCCADTGGLGQG